MFEDLVRPREIPIEEIVERCPYCGSYVIHRYDKKCTLDDKWTRKIICRLCNKNWTIVYNEDQSPQQITFDEYIKGKK